MPVRATRRWPALALLGLLASAPQAAGCLLESNAQTIQVYAASSTQGLLGALERRYELLHPGFDVVIEYGDSRELAERIAAGESVDVFVAADEADRTVVEDARATNRGRPFAVSELVVAFPKGNPNKVRELDDVAAKELRVLVADAESSLGTLTREALERTEHRKRLAPNFVEVEPHTTDMVAALRAKEGDVAILSKADVQGKKRIRSFELPEDAEARTTYHVVPLADGESPDQAQKIVAFFASKGAQTTLQKHGFRKP